MTNVPLIDGTTRPPVTQVRRPSPVTVNPAPGAGAVAGVDPSVFSAYQTLTADQIALAQQGLAGTQAIGQAEVGLQQEELSFNRELGLKQIGRQTEDAAEAVRNNALQRGIFNSGIRVGGEQEVAEIGAESTMLLERDVALGLQNLQLRLAQLSADYNLGLATVANQFTMQDMEFAQSMITAGGGVSSGFSAGTASGSGNLDPANVSAAKAGIGAYGARVQVATQYGQQLSQQFGLGADGIGYFRPASESTGPGRASDSDHITGGAVDFIINPTTQYSKGVAMVAELKRLMAQGIVSGYIWHPDRPGDAHYGHIHVSFALPGGVAGTVGANVTGLTSVRPTSTTSSTTTRTASPSGGGGAYAV